MYNREKIEKLISFVFAHDGIGDKTKLTKMVQSEFALIRDHLLEIQSYLFHLCVNMIKYRL